MIQKVTNNTYANIIKNYIEKQYPKAQTNILKNNKVIMSAAAALALEAAALIKKPQKEEEKEESKTQ